MKSNHLVLTTSALILTLGISGNTASAAEASSNQFSMPFNADSNNSVGRLFKAYEGIRKNIRLNRILKKSKVQLSLSQRVADKKVETTKFQAYFNGLEVIGDMALHHESAQGTEVSNYVSEFDLDTTPTLTADQAIAIAQSLNESRGSVVNEAPVLKILPSENRDSAVLLYSVHLEGQSLDQGAEVMINAHSGAVIAHLTHHMPLAQVDVLTASDKCQTYILDEFVDINPALCDRVIRGNNVVRGKVADGAAQRALKNSIAVLNYFQREHNRNSYDNAGATITNVVHVGRNFANAFWHPGLKIMAYGDGDKDMKDMTLALDVAGHEITHAITSSTAKLIGMRESGALNEAYSDFFGKMIENKGNWALGKDLFEDPNSFGLRNMANPGAVKTSYLNSRGQRVVRRYPAVYSSRFKEPEVCDQSNDRCWVHVNATIPGYASYLVYRAIGKAKAQELYYNVLTQRLTSTARFVDQKNETLKACAKLLPSADCVKVAAVFKQVGI